MNPDQAIDFVRSGGSKFELARLSNVLGEPFDRDGVISGFSAIQNPDGGFPYSDRKGFPSCVSNTAMALHNLIEMGLRDSEPAMRGLEFLRGLRGDEGEWQENPIIMPLDPPFWDMPGDEKTTLWLTADVADVIQRMGHPVPPETIDFLKEKQGEDGRFSGYYHTTWIALSLFGCNGLNEKETFTSALSYLETAELEDLDTSCIAWCLDCAGLGGVDTESPLVKRLLVLLSSTQEEDGGWPSDGGEPTRVRDTNSVLAALKAIGEL